MSYFTRQQRLFAHIVNVSFWWASVSHGQDPLPPIPAGEDVIVSLKKDAPAPFGGQLFDTNTAIRWGLWLQQFRERSQVEAERSRAVCNAELNYKDRAATIEGDRATAVYGDLMTRFQASEKGRLQAQYELANPPWYKSGTFQFTLGVLTTVTVVFVAHKSF